MAFEHVSVLLNETVDGLNVKPDGVYVDATLGGGGHAYEVCRRLGSKGRFIGIDQDADAIKAAGERLKGFGEKVTIIRSNYRDMKPQLQNIGVDKVDGIVIDLGVSSYQLDTAERGFSYRVDAPLDMRMDQRQKMTARDIVNEYSESELYRVIRDYGEDKFAKNIAKHIVEERRKNPIETTGQLNEIISHAIPMKFRKTSGRFSETDRFSRNCEIFPLKFLPCLLPEIQRSEVSHHIFDYRLYFQFHPQRASAEPYFKFPGAGQ